MQAPAVLGWRADLLTFVCSVQPAAQQPISTWRPQSRPRPVDRGLGRLGRPEPAVASSPVGQRRALRCRSETDPVESALAPALGPDVPHPGPVLALVVADLDLAPAAVPHVFPRAFVVRLPHLPAGRGPDPAPRTGHRPSASLRR